MTGRQTQQENLSLEQWLWLRIEPSASILRPAILLMFAPRRKDLHGGLQRHGACQSSIHLIGGPGHSASGHRWSAKRVFDCAGSQTHVIAIEFMRIMLSCRFFTSIVTCMYHILYPVTSPTMDVSPYHGYACAVASLCTRFSDVFHLEACALGSDL